MATTSSAKTRMTITRQVQRNTRRTIRRERLGISESFGCRRRGELVEKRLHDLDVFPKRKFKDPALAVNDRQRVGIARSCGAAELQAQHLRLLAVPQLDDQLVSILTKAVKLAFALTAIHPNHRSKFAQPIDT